MRRRSMLQALLPLVFALGVALVWACDGSSGTPAAGSPDGGGGGADGHVTCGCGAAVCGTDPCGNSCGACEGATVCFGGQCVDDAGCDFSGAFVPFSQATLTRAVGGAVKVLFTATAGALEPPFAKLSIEMDTGVFSGAAGTHDLAEAGRKGCDLCVKGYRVCNEDDCFNKFIPTSGELVLHEAAQPGGRLRGELRGVMFEQYKIDAAGQRVVDTKKVKTWCLDSFAFDQEVPEFVPASNSCVPDGTGRDVGSNIKDFALQNCNGDWVNLHDRCGLYDAVWLVASAEWCGACETWIKDKVGPYYTQHTDEGLDILVVLGERADTGAPTLANCNAYAQAEGINPALVFIDNDGTTSWKELFGHINNYAVGGSIGLPWNVILDAQSMEYVYSDTSGTGQLYQTLEELLAR